VIAVRLQTPNKIRDLQRGLYLKAKRERRCRLPGMGIPSKSSRKGRAVRIANLACLEVKMIGKPSAGKLHAGFDEGG